MKIEFYLPKYLTGGGELITLSLIKCLHDTEPNIKLNFYCENSKKIKDIEKKILRELNFSNKFLLINKLILNFARSFF